MKKVMMVWMMVLVIGSGVLIAQTQSDSASLILSGVVGANVSITIEGTGNEGLNLQLPQSNVLVGTATEVANVPYNVSAFTTNGFALTFDSENAISYTVSYDGQTVSQNGDNIFGSPQSTTSGRNRSIRISYTDVSGRTEGMYSDEITFTISAE